MVFVERKINSLKETRSGIYGTGSIIYHIWWNWRFSEKKTISFAISPI
jgi:hypothetical protein